MKLRNGFVSNSSSSSFLIPRRFVSEYQLERIKGHIPYEECENPGKCDRCLVEDDYTTYQSPCDPCDRQRDRWRITVDEDLVEGYTNMDNFGMRDLFEEISIPMDKVRWGYDG